MARLSKAAAAILAAAPPLPLSEKQWKAVVQEIGLSKQQARAAELVLRDLCNKQIGIVMGISAKTVQDYLDRAGRCADTRGRMQLSMRVLEVSLRLFCK